MTAPVDPGVVDTALSNPSVTTPTGVLIAVAVYVANQYFRSRAEKRSDAEAQRGSESGIVETSKAILTAAQEQIDEMREDARLDRLESREKLNAAYDRIRELEDENRRLRGVPPRIAEQPAITGYPDDWRRRPGADEGGPPTAPSGRPVGGAVEQTGGRRRRRYAPDEG